MLEKNLVKKWIKNNYFIKISIQWGEGGGCKKVMLHEKVRRSMQGMAKGPTECCPQGVTKYFYSSERELNQVFWCYTTYLLILFSFWPKINFKSVDFEHFKNGSKWWKWVKMVKMGQNGEIGSEWWKWDRWWKWVRMVKMG